MKIDAGIVAALARQELYDEQFRQAVEAEKIRLRTSRWWHRFIPFGIRITIYRRIK